MTLPVLADPAATRGTCRDATNWTTTAFELAYGAEFLITGPLSHRRGRRPVTVGGLAVTALSALVVISAPSPGAGIGIQATQRSTASISDLTFLGVGVIAQLVDGASGRQAVFVVGSVFTAFVALPRGPRLTPLHVSDLAALGSIVGLYTGVPLAPPDGVVSRSAPQSTDGLLPGEPGHPTICRNVFGRNYFDQCSAQPARNPTMGGGRPRSRCLC